MTLIIFSIYLFNEFIYTSKHNYTNGGISKKSTSYIWSCIFTDSHYVPVQRRSTVLNNLNYKGIFLINWKYDYCSRKPHIFFWQCPSLWQRASFLKAETHKWNFFSACKNFLLKNFEAMPVLIFREQIAVLGGLGYCKENIFCWFIPVSCR